MLKMIDLFAGAGGFHLAFKGLADCVYASEIDPIVQTVYEANHGFRPHGDITLQATKDAIPEEFDILCGGFPCQAFSHAGKRLGFTDTRGTLFFDVAEIAKKHKPSVVFLENVAGLTTHDDGKTFTTILNVLDEIGYEVKYAILNSMEVANIPHNRERIYIVGFNREKVSQQAIDQFSFPAEMPLTTSIQDLLEKGVIDSKYYYTKAKYPDIFDILDSSMSGTDTLYQWRRKYVRENKSKVSPCLTANMGTGGHNVPLLREVGGAIRKLTPRECFNFQGYTSSYVFPPKVSDSRLYKIAGNSVTVPVLEAIARNILVVKEWDNHPIDIEVVGVNTI